MKIGNEKEFYVVGSIPLIIGENSVALVSDGNGGRSFDKAKQYAAFIVRAVNAHDELVEALRYVDGSLDRRVYGDLKARIRAALAKAEGK